MQVDDRQVIGKRFRNNSHLPLYTETFKIAKWNCVLTGFRLINYIIYKTLVQCPKNVFYLIVTCVCRANSFKRSISHVEFNKSHVVLRNDVQFSKSTSHLLKTTGTF